jgi:hypothetical protein
VARYFTATVDSAFRLPTSNVTLSDINNHDLAGVHHLLKHRDRLRKLLQETRYPICKMAVIWVKKAIRKMNSRKALQRWEMEIVNCEIKSQSYCEDSRKEE